MKVSAKITGIKYKPLLCAKLKSYSFEELSTALSESASFNLNVDERNSIAVSWWVSAKRTRSYPYARVYDTLGFTGRKITIIPIIKDEGKEGDRDFLQWDTVSLMSLLGVYVIIGYYADAEKSKRYRHKVTNQRFDVTHNRIKIRECLEYQSDALHWNLSQVSDAGKIAQVAIDSYEKISSKLKVEMHSKSSAEKRIEQLMKGKDAFMTLSRELAEKAQKRESLTVQPKEYLSGSKCIITIQNYLGGFYYFTADEMEVKGNDIFLIEGKHSKGTLPSIGDIKDGLIKMFLFTNLEEVKVDNKIYNPKPVLKLTVENHFNRDALSSSQERDLNLLMEESKLNNFEVRIL